MARKKVGEILAQQVRESRSPLYQWLHDHYEEIAPIISKQARPSWEALAETVGKSSKLKRPSRQGVRKAWLKLEASKQPDKPDQPGAVPTESPAPVTYYAPLEPPEPEPEPDRPRAVAPSLACSVAPLPPETTEQTKKRLWPWKR